MTTAAEILATGATIAYELFSVGEWRPYSVVLQAGDPSCTKGLAVTQKSVDKFRRAAVADRGRLVPPKKESTPLPSGGKRSGERDGRKGTNPVGDATSCISAKPSMTTTHPVVVQECGQPL